MNEKNKEWLRKLNDIDFAKWIVNHIADAPWCDPNAPVNPITKQCELWDCEKCCLNWLNEERKDNE